MASLSFKQALSYVKKAILEFGYQHVHIFPIYLQLKKKVQVKATLY